MMMPKSRDSSMSRDPGYLANVTDIAWLAHSLISSSGERKTIVDASIFDPQTHHLSTIPPGERDELSMIRHAEFYDIMAPFVNQQNILFPENNKFELNKLLIMERLELRGDESIAAEYLDGSIDRLTRIISRKSCFNPKMQEEDLEEAISERRKEAHSPWLENDYLACSKCDLSSIRAVLSISSRGEEASLATRDNAQLRVLKELVRGGNQLVKVIRYNITRHEYRSSTLKDSSLSLPKELYLKVSN